MGQFRSVMHTLIFCKKFISTDSGFFGQQLEVMLLNSFFKLCSVTEHLKQFDECKIAAWNLCLKPLHASWWIFKTLKIDLCLTKIL